MTGPCLKQLDADCFRAHPAWAKRAFAYRLVHLLTPKPLTKRLPKVLRLALIAPGVDIPPGVELPPGVVVSPGTQVPPGWSSEIVPPPGITIAPGTVFPPGWSPGDPLPLGVTLDPGATFPPGWSPGDPLPDGAIPPGTLPPGVETTGPTPPTYVAPWEPGPISPPAGRLPVPAGLWFDEPFSNLTASSWSDDSYQTGSASIVAAALKLHGISSISHSIISRTDSRAWPENWQLEIKVNYLTGSYEMRYRFFTGTYSFEFRLYPTTQVRLFAQYGPDYWTVPNYIDQYKVCLINVTGGTLDLYWDGTLIKSGWSLKSDTSNAGLMECRLANICTTYTDYLKITAL